MGVASAFSIIRILGRTFSFQRFQTEKNSHKTLIGICATEIPENIPKMAAKEGGSGKLVKTKANYTFLGFDYVLQKHRKDGSSTWKCTDRDCEGRIWRKGTSEEDVEVLKDHSVELPSIKAAIVHLGMHAIKEHVTNNPEGPFEDVLKFGMLRATDLMIASLPSPEVIAKCIEHWKNPASSSAKKTPKSKEKSGAEGSRKKTVKALMLPRKRMKLLSEGSDEGENSSPSVRKKRSRSLSRSSPELESNSESDED